MDAYKIDIFNIGLEIEISGYTKAQKRNNRRKKMKCEEETAENMDYLRKNLFRDQYEPSDKNDNSHPWDRRGVFWTSYVQECALHGKHFLKIRYLRNPGGCDGTEDIINEEVVQSNYSLI
jgi:hypothetical protein